MAFGVGNDEPGFDNWFPDMQKDKIEELLDKLDQFKLLKNPKYGFHIDGGGEFCIYPAENYEDPKQFLYEGHIHGFISDLMQYFNVRDDI